MDYNEKYKTAKSLAADLAEEYMADLISDMMILNGREKANAVRNMSEANIDQLDSRVQEFRGYERTLYSAICQLIGGYKGYKLIKINANP